MDTKTVLICDDDEGIVDVATIILKDAGFRVVPVTSSLAVIDTVKNVKPDIILLDLWMPDLSGEELTVKLKKDPTTSSIPVILVSASRDTENIATRSGANDFIKKPFDIDELEQYVRKYT
jgi:DNA-binding response OmpR family regulator